MMNQTASAAVTTATAAMVQATTTSIPQAAIVAAAAAAAAAAAGMPKLLGIETTTGGVVGDGLVAVGGNVASSAVVGIGGNVDEDVTAGLNISPVTLSSDWSRVVRLLILLSLAVIGSVGNVFMISAVMVEDHLKKRGNAFLVNVALADLLISGMVIPASAILILAGNEESPKGVCRFEWTLEALCFLVTVLTLAAIAVENYLRLCWPVERYNIVATTGRVTGAVIFIWILATVSVGLQSYFDLGPNLCNIDWRKPYTQTTNTTGIVSATAIVAAPMLFTVCIYLRLLVGVRGAQRGSYKPPVAFNWDYELTKANLWSFFFFGVFWLPFAVTFCISVVRPVSPRLVIYLAWFALSKSCFNNLLYCIADRHFRSAYVKLFHYCCCKTTVSFSRRQRGGGGGGGDGSGPGGRGSGDVRLRVHIIHSYTSGAACRMPAQTTGRSNGGRDVYEL
ncbi:hypothetical protein TKK_0000463 [Trichogramma kaykai]|uniref:G-protein coupled receptors family 1 profile domain-containing protein n=1 Tax=Trichogramma kaykai TaxID=54128 RepID=A0ABD2WKU6_9HYME